MADLIYSAITSLDGYVADRQGNFDWAAPDEEVHEFVNDLERAIGTYLYGRRMCEVMRYWETAHTVTGQTPTVLDYSELWQAADKVVYLTTLEAAPTSRTRIECEFDPESVRTTKASAAVTCPWADPTSPRSRSGLDWSTSSTGSSRRSWSVAGRRGSPTTSVWSSSSRTNAGSPAARCS